MFPDNEEGRFYNELRDRLRSCKARGEHTPYTREEELDNCLMRSWLFQTPTILLRPYYEGQSYWHVGTEHWTELQESGWVGLEDAIVYPDRTIVPATQPFTLDQIIEPATP